MGRHLEPVALAGLPGGGAVPLSDLRAPDGLSAPAAAPDAVACRHCGEPCPVGAHGLDGHSFCCLGCQTVFVLLRDNGLGDFYTLADRPGSRVDGETRPDRWAFLDDPAVAAKLLDFNDGRTARVTFHLPAVHCVACVWLLENLFRLDPAIGRATVNFARREIALTYAPDRIRLSEVAALLSRLGYEPAVTLAELDGPRRPPGRRLALQIGVAGFAFGNIMLFSLPLYLGLDSATRPLFTTLFGGLSLLLALPVLIYSAMDFWRSAFASLRQKTLTLDVPIVAGLVALFGQSAWEILTASGGGYLDSLTGLVFLLLCGRAFQQKTHERLAFDRDYRGFLPLGAVRVVAAVEETIPISRIGVGDRLRVRHGELIPADSQLLSGSGWVDYSFVTGESEPVSVPRAGLVFAGGRQVGGEIEVGTVRPVSESYLTSLWNEATFRKDRDNAFDTLTNRYSRRFTVLVVAIALAAAVGWTFAGDVARGLKAFTSVLIIACPCALALAAPFTLGTAHRLLARRGVCLRNSQVVETVACVDAIALDKTGTLTAADASRIAFHGVALDPTEARQAAAVFRQSAHPYARRLATLEGDDAALPTVEAFREESGRGVAAAVEGRVYVAGSADWLRAAGVPVEGLELPPGGTVFLAVDGRFRGVFVLGNELRPKVDALLRELSSRFELALVSGDNARERERFSALFGGDARLHFNLSPHDKLALIQRLQGAGRTVMMVGDGLNDAGALCQGDVGVAVVDGVGRFSPASDIIMDAPMVPRLAGVVEFCRRATRVVRLGLGVSAVYNVVGVAIAAAGVLSPLVCAVLMPLSSVSVVFLAVGLTTLAARRTGLAERPTSLPWK